MMIRPERGVRSPPIRGPSEEDPGADRAPSDERKRLPALTLLQPRGIEAEVVVPLIPVFAAELGDERALEIVRGLIVSLAHEAGTVLATRLGEASLEAFDRGDRPMEERRVLEIEMLEQTPERLSINVTDASLARCTPPSA